MDRSRGWFNWRTASEGGPHKGKNGNRQDTVILRTWGAALLRPYVRTKRAGERGIGDVGT